ncbi:MAG: hypothetical protein RR449_01710 [Christensenella sp.]
MDIGNRADALLKNAGSELEILHNGKIIGTTNGIKHSGNALQLASDAEVEIGDVLKNRDTGKEYQITDLEPIKSKYLRGGTVGIIAEYSVGQPQSSVIYVETVNGPAIIGSQQSANINIGVSLGDIENLIRDVRSEDRELLNELLEQLQLLESGKISIRKGGLSMFMESLNKYAPLLSAVSGFLIKIVGGG